MRPYLSRIFASSPIGPLQKHMAEVLQCVQQLHPFIQAVVENDTQAREQFHEKIKAHENNADAIKKDLRLHLPTSLFMPIDRRDMLEILSMQEKLANAVCDVARIISVRNLKLPEVIAAGYLQMVDSCIEACEKAELAIRELDELIATGFDNSERKRISAVLKALDDIEEHSDERVTALSKVLMTLEDSYPPVEMMFLYRVLDRTYKIAERAQRVGGRLQLTLAR